MYLIMPKSALCQKALPFQPRVGWFVYGGIIYNAQTSLPAEGGCRDGEEYSFG